MCLIVFAWQHHPDFPLVLAANRDERHVRPSAPMEWWADRERVLGGRDLVAGGSWLALTDNGRFAAVTNFRERTLSRGVRSRGELVGDFVCASGSASEHVATIALQRYAGFCALFKDRDQLIHASNREAQSRVLAPGVYGMSNAQLDTPWPKLVHARAELTELVSQPTLKLDDLLRILSTRSATPPAADTASAYDGTSPNARNSMTAPFIVDATYGTRCSTAVLFRTDGHVEVAERRFGPPGIATGESRFVFLLGP